MRAPLLFLALLTGCPQRAAPPEPAPAPAPPVATPPRLAMPRGTAKIVLPLHGAGALQAGDHLDVLSVAHGRVALFLEDVLVTGLGAPDAARDVSLAVPAGMVQAATLMALEGELHAAVRGPGDDERQEEPLVMTHDLLQGERPNSLRLKHRVRLERVTDGGDITLPPPGFRAFAFPFANVGVVTAGDHVDVTTVLEDATGARRARVFEQNVEVLHTAPDELTLLLLPEEAALLLQAAADGELKVTLRHPDATNTVDDDARITPDSVRDGEQARELLRKRQPTIPLMKGTSP